jgi:hypothetical protein
LVPGLLVLGPLSKMALRVHWNDLSTLNANERAMDG